MIKAVAFDYGGVIEIKDGDLVQEISDYLGVSKDDWRKEYFKLNYLHNIESKDWEEVARLASRKLNATEEQLEHISGLIRKSYDTRRINRELIEIIKKLKDQGYKVGLLSNNSNRLRAELESLNLIDLFDAVVISAEVGLQKPQQKIFETFFDKLGVKSNEAIFVDDSKQSLLTAGDIGYIPILFIDNSQFKKELSAVLGGATLVS